MGAGNGGGTCDLRADEIEPRLLEELERAQRVELAPQRPDRVERVVDAVEREQRDDHVPRARERAATGPR